MAETVTIDVPAAERVALAALEDWRRTVDELAADPAPPGKLEKLQTAGRALYIAADTLKKAKGATTP